MAFEEGPAEPAAAGTFRALEETAIEVGSSALTYYRGGSHGAPLVLLNALGQALEPWFRLIDRLLPRRVVISELRPTDAPQRPLTLDDQVDHLEAVLDHAKIRACHLVGWCTGPKVALACYLRRPGSVLSMVFLNAAFKHATRPPELDTPYERNLELVCRAVDQRPETAARLTKIFEPGVFGGSRSGGLEDAVRKRFVTDAALVTYAREHLDFWARDATADAANVRIPMLFVSAEHDEIVSPASVRVAAERFPTARYTEVAGGTHYALYEDADRVARLIEDFVL